VVPHDEGVPKSRRSLWHRWRPFQRVEQAKPSRRSRGARLVPVDRHARSLSLGDLELWPVGEKRSVLINLETGQRVRLTVERTGERKVTVHARGGIDLERLEGLPWSTLVPKSELHAHRADQWRDGADGVETGEHVARVLQRLARRER
jgi:hypothetical protein